MAVKYIVCLVLVLFPQVVMAKHVPTILWPVTLAQPWDKLSSIFGPRLQAAQDYRYDFHRGIDLPGDSSDSIVAVADGTVFRIYSADDTTSPYYNSGNVIIVRHQFTKPLRFHGQSLQTYYSLYAHLANFASDLKPDDVVQAGDVLGVIGDTGATDFSHLHFEIRVGTTCSLSAACNTTGFDPHIHPFTLLKYPQANTAGLRVWHNNGSTALQVRLKLPRAELDFNRLIVTTYAGNGQRLKRTNLNLNRRTGVNASSTETLDDQTYRGIKIIPAKFSQTSDSQVIRFRFRRLLSAKVSTVKVQVRDVHGNVLKTKTYTGTSQSL